MATASGGSSSNDGDDSQRQQQQQQFECNICLEVANEPVVSYCGHLFCWSCLYTWMDTQSRSASCPVCKSGISRDKVIPLYGRGGTGNTSDPRQRVPPRPQGQRSEPEQQPGFPGNLFGHHGHDHAFQFTFGIGGFPFAFFGSNFNLNGNQQQQQRNGGAGGAGNLEEDAFLSKVFLYIAIIFVVWLLLA